MFPLDLQNVIQNDVVFLSHEHFVYYVTHYDLQMNDQDDAAQNHCALHSHAYAHNGDDGDDLYDMSILDDNNDANSNAPNT